MKSSTKNKQCGINPQAKSHAKKMKIRKLTQQLENLYRRANNSQSMESNHNIYMQCIQLTEQINSQLERINCYSESSKKSQRKPIINMDMRDILSNNMTLGSKIKCEKMVAGFAYITARVLKEGMSSLGYYLNVIKSINQNAKNEPVQAKNISQNLNQLQIACQIRFFIKLEEIYDDKNIVVLRKTLANLCRVFQRSRQPVVEEFYHWGLRNSRASNQFQLYLQFLGSYFQKHIQHETIPRLDICRIIFDLLSFENNEYTQKHQQIISILIRNCFYLVGQKFSATGLYIEDHVLQQTARKCFQQVQNFGPGQKITVAIFQSFIKIEKIELIVSSIKWKQIEFKKIKRNRRSIVSLHKPDYIKICQFICSSFLFIRQQKNYMLQKVKNNDSLLLQFKDKLEQNIDNLMASDQGIIFIWGHLINQIHAIKAELITKCSRKKIITSVAYIQKCLVFIKIQDIILSHPIHIQACDNLYSNYTRANIYLLLIGQLITPKTPRIMKKNVNQLCQRMDQYEGEIYQYWDQLLYLCIYLLNGYFCPTKQTASDIRSLTTLSKLIFFIRNLMGLQKIIASKKCKISENSNKQVCEFTSLICVCIFLVTPHRLSLYWQARQNKQLLYAKYIIFNIFVKNIIKKLVDKNMGLNGQQFLPKQNQLYAFFIFMYPMFKQYCGLDQVASLKRIKSTIINRISSFEERILYRKVFHRLLADILQFKKYCQEQQQIERKQRSEQEDQSNTYDLLQRKNTSKSKLSMQVQSYIQLLDFEGECNQINNIGKANEDQLNESKIQCYLQEYLKIMPTKKNNENKDPIISQQYESLITLDYIIWVQYSCKAKGFFSFEEIAQEMIEEHIYQFNKRNHSKNVRKSTVSKYLQALGEVSTASSANLNPLVQHYVGLSQKSNSLEIILECYSKMIYLLENKSDSYASQKKTNISDDKYEMNIQFEIQQLSIHITKLNKLCRNLHNKLNNLWSCQFVSFFDPSTNNLLCDNTQVRVISINRLIVAINNIISIAKNIGYGQKYQQSSSENCLFEVLSSMKLSLAKIHSNDRYYYEHAEEVFKMGQVHHSEYRDSIATFVYERKKSLKNLSKNSSMKSEKFLQSLLNNIQILLNIQPKNSSEKQLNRLLEAIFAINNLQHMNPHKKLIRNVSGYIWERACLNESQIMQYKASILPITYATLDCSNHSGEFAVPKQLLKNQADWSSGQLAHHTLNRILSQILQCLVLNNQLSQFRSVLKLSLIFFIRSRNLLSFLSALKCFVKKNILQCKTINILVVSDSICLILTEIFQSNFNHTRFNKWCSKYLNDRKHRKSLAFQSSPFQITRSLALCLNGCGEIGLRVYQLLITCASTLFRIPEWIIFYYSMTLKPEQQKSKLQQQIINFMKKLLQIIQNKQEVSASMLKKIQYQVLEYSRQSAPISYYLCFVVESALSEIISYDPNLHLSDHTLLELSVIMLDHNFQYKKMSEQITALYQTGVKLQMSQIVQNSNKIYNSYKTQYLNHHFQKLHYLQSNRLQHPLTILYPLGTKVYGIQVSQPLVIISVQRMQFQDYIETVNSLLARNQSILNDQKIDPKEWWKNRDRFNREIGKIVNEMYKGIWDLEIPTSKYRSDIKNKLYKVLTALKINPYCANSLELVIASFCEHYHQEIQDQFGELDIQFVKNQLSNIVISKETVINQNVLILIPAQYYAFPFETSQFLCNERAVYRIPSISYIVMIQVNRMCRLVKIRDTKYLVNSKNDLPETQAAFLKIKEKFENWKGIIGRKPTLSEFLEFFESQIFIFMGHGSGSGHISEKQFYCKIIRCVMLLFGCSSAAIGQNKCQYHGITLSHLINGCPCLLGCLWEVTDRDTDKLTQKLFKSVLQGPQNIAKTLSQCRKKCRHQYLNGGAIVVYGMPTYLHSQ